MSARCWYGNRCSPERRRAVVVPNPVQRGASLTRRRPDWLVDEFEDAQVLDAEVAGELAPAPPAPQPPAPAHREAAPATGLMSYEDALDHLWVTSPPPVPLARRRGRR